ncbi:MAG: DUF262 domain-containing protein [Nitrososphaerota archaeon]
MTKDNISYNTLSIFSITELVKMVEDGKISEREWRTFRWANDKVRDLADSIYRGYPIGSIILYKLPEEHMEKQERFLVVDGYQRLLYLILIVKGYKNKNLWFDPKNERFELEPYEGENWVKISEILQFQEEADLKKFLRDKGFSPQEGEKILNLWSKFKEDFKIPVYKLTAGLNADDLIKISVRIHSACTPPINTLMDTDVYSLIIATVHKGSAKKLIELHKQLKKEISGISNETFIQTFDVFVRDGDVWLISNVCDQPEKLKRVLQAKKKDEIEQLLSEMEKSMWKVVSLLKQSGILYLPYEKVFITMAYYFYKKGDLTEEEKIGLYKWSVLASYFERYSRNVESELRKDMETIKRGGSWKDLIKNIQSIYRNEDLKKIILSRIDGNEFYFDDENRSKLLLYALLKESDAKDFLTKEPLIFEQGKLEVHHIFPFNLMRGNRLWNHIGNITLLTSSTNQRLGNKPPENYLPKVDPEILRSHYIPEDAEYWKSENFERFVEQRKNLLKSAVEKFFKNIPLT